MFDSATARLIGLIHLCKLTQRKLVFRKMWLQFCSPMSQIVACTLFRFACQTQNALLFFAIFAGDGYLRLASEQTTRKRTMYRRMRTREREREINAMLPSDRDNRWPAIHRERFHRQRIKVVLIIDDQRQCWLLFYRIDWNTRVNIKIIAERTARCWR